MGNEVVETRTATIWLDADAIIHLVEKPGSETILEDAKEYVTAFLNVSKGKRSPVFVDINMSKSITREARQYLGGSEAVDVVSAVGLYADLPVSRVLGNFFLKLARPSYPIRMFSSEEEALEWLNKFVT